MEIYISDSISKQDQWEWILPSVGEVQFWEVILKCFSYVIPSGSEGSLFLNQLKKKVKVGKTKVCAPVAQLDRALVFGTKGWGFKSLRAHFKIVSFCETILKCFIVSKQPEWLFATKGGI